MTSRLVGVFVCVAAATAACGHTRTVGPAEGTPAGDRKKSEASAAEAPRERPLLKPERDHGSGSKGAVPLPTSPAGLLKPGALKMIQQRLSNAGALREEQQTGELDGETRAALKKFQEANGLPATGDPDGATVSKLGLKASDLFKGGGETSGK